MYNQFTNKNNIGYTFTILLVILLSYNKFLKFLLNTILGRVFLISFIIIISHINKFLGIFSVLFVFIKTHNSNIGYKEGASFTVPYIGNNTSTGATGGGWSSMFNNYYAQDNTSLATGASGATGATAATGGGWSSMFNNYYAQANTSLATGAAAPTGATATAPTGATATGATGATGATATGATGATATGATGATGARGATATATATVSTSATPATATVSTSATATPAPIITTPSPIITTPIITTPAPIITNPSTVATNIAPAPITTSDLSDANTAKAIAAVKAILDTKTIADNNTSDGAIFVANAAASMANLILAQKTNLAPDGIAVANAAADAAKYVVTSIGRVVNKSDAYYSYLSSQTKGSVNSAISNLLFHKPVVPNSDSPSIDDIKLFLAQDKAIFVANAAATMTDLILEQKLNLAPDAIAVANASADAARYIVSSYGSSVNKTDAYYSYLSSETEGFTTINRNNYDNLDFFDIENILRRSNQSNLL